MKILSNLDADTQKAQAQLQQAQEALDNIKNAREQAIKEQKQAKIDERETLLANARKFRADSIAEAQLRNLDKAQELRGFAEDCEKAAKEIFIEGEVNVAEEQEEKPVFQEGMRLPKVLLILSAMTFVLHLLSGYINHLVQDSVKNISISIGAEWVHALQTTQFWTLDWFLAFVMMYFLFRSMSRFINPKIHPEFDLTTKLFTECTPQFQIIVSLLLLLSMVFSWVMIFLHSPVSNS